jgi:transcriptional regulator with XRE-family HTH domain
VLETWLESLTSTPEEMSHFQQERVILDATERICELMEDLEITRTDLADRLNKSKAHVSQLLSGRRNMTLRTLSDVYCALGRTLVLKDVPLVQPGSFAGAEEGVKCEPIPHISTSEPFKTYSYGSAPVIIPFESKFTPTDHEPRPPAGNPMRRLGS